MNRFAKFSWGVLVWIILVILWGAIVRATGSGAGCGNHWPSCNGAIIPDPKHIQTVIEFIHRIMSGVGLILVFSLLIWGLRSYPASSHQRIGFIGAAIFIVVEALLGAGLVLFKLVGSDSSSFRAAAVSLHLLNTFILVGFLAMNAWWASGGKPVRLAPARPILYLFAVGLLGVAVIGMSGAITALGDTLFPSTSLTRTLAEQADPNSHFLVQLRIYHPIIAIMVGMFTIYLSRYIYNHSVNRTQKYLCNLLTGLIIVQGTAGITNVLLLAPVWMQIVHLFIADTIWVSLVLLAGHSLSLPDLEHA